MSESPFSSFTLWQYRNVGVLCLAVGAFFVLVGGAGFKGGVNLGLGLDLLASGLASFGLRRYVGRRLHLPAEFWRDQQRRVGARVWAAIGLAAGLGVLVTLLAWVGDAPWLSGFAVGLSGLPLLMVVGRLTGQVRPL